MAEENVDLVRRMIDSANRGDWTAWATGLHDDIAYFPLAENPQTEPVHGVPAVLDFLSDWFEPWDEYKVEVIRTVDTGGLVFVATRHSARQQTGVEINMDMYIVGKVRDRKFVELRWFMDEADALEASGMSK